MEELMGERPLIGQLDLEDQKGGRNCEDAVTERLEPRGLAHVLDMYADHRSAIRSPSKRNTTMPYCTYPVSSAFQRRRRATRSSSPKTSSISIFRCGWWEIIAPANALAASGPLGVPGGASWSTKSGASRSLTASSSPPVTRSK